MSDQSKIDKLTKLLELSQNDTLTPKEVERFLKFLVKFITDSRDNFEGISEKSLAQIREAVSTIRSEHSEALRVADSRNKGVMASLERELARIKAITPKDGKDGGDGADGLDGSDGKPGKDGSPDSAEQIRDKLLTLVKENRLDKSAIKGLEDLVGKKDLARAISILDQRTQFLINKVTTSSSSGGGATGAQGPAGATGAQGPQGSQGSMGSQGATGNDGGAGAVGAQGTQGSIGLAGAQGATGNDGSNGAAGAQGTQGSIGVQGTQGSQGSVGNDGVAGATGATGATGSQGPQGTQGSIGLAGADGTAGTRGPQGTQGTQGSLGATGATGSQGPQGTQGTQGSLGVTGAQGATGNQGTQGTAGSRGSQGSQGTQGSVGAQGTQGSIGPTGYVAPRVTATGSTLSPNPLSDSTDIFKLTAQGGTAAFTGPAGTPVDGQKIMIEILATGANRNITFGAGFTAGGVALPTIATRAKKTTLGFEYDTSNSFNKWLLIAKAEQI